MKKIGILTLHNFINFGSFLQAYALKKYLSNLGYKVKVINYLNPNFSMLSHSIWVKWKKNINIIDNNILKPLKCIKALLLILKDPFRNFTKLFSLTKECFCVNDIDNLNFNTIILGSDQIWNTKDRTELDKASFGYGYKTKNIITYGVSIGHEKYSSKHEKIIKEYTKSIRTISLRENQSLEYMTNLLNRNIKLVCDPTFLLDKEEYEKLVRKSKLHLKEKFVFVYNINNSDILTNIANKLKDKYIIYEMNRDCIFNHNKYIGPIEFLYLIKNAEYIFTDSFHGTVFSIIFEKKFYTYASNEGKNRYLTILGKEGLTNRLIDENFEFSEEEIDYTKAKENLEPFIEYSKKYLKENI